MKYKIGDKVRVKKDLEPGNFYGRAYYSMIKLITLVLWMNSKLRTVL